MSSLPKNLKAFFWDYDFNLLSWQTDKDLIVSRILAHGDWQSILWLRKKIDNEELRDWIIKRQGRGLEPRQLRFWELMLELPHRLVNSWISNQKQGIWHQRTSP